MDTPDDKIISLKHFKKKKQREVDADIDDALYDQMISDEPPFEPLTDAELLAFVKVLLYLKEIGNSSVTVNLMAGSLSIEIGSFESFDSDTHSPLMSGEKYTITSLTTLLNNSDDLCDDDELITRMRDLVRSLDIDYLDGET